MAVGKPNPVGKMTGANDGVADSIITHAVNLERLKSSEVQAVWAMLRKVQGDIIEQLNALDPTAVGGKTRVKRLERLLANTTATIKANYQLIQKQHSGTLATIADLEGKSIQQAVGVGVGGEPKIGAALLTSLPPTPVLRALVDNTLIMGAPHKEHWGRQAGDLQQRFQDQMREGILAGEGVDNLVRRVRGTQASNFKDGIMEVKRYQAAALVRTSVQAVSNAARQTVIEANADIFNGVQWLSTLDSRTSDVCKARSGLRWDNGFNPIGHSKQWSAPPAHWNCRSVVTPITKSWEELAGKKVVMNSGELTENFKNELGKLGFTALQIKGIRRNMQSSMDGAVPAEFTYEDWIKRKPEVFQKQVLGEARWRLWNSGKIGFVDLVDQRSNPLSLEALQELIDKGKTSIARASKQAAKQSAEQAAQEAAGLAKKELEAETLLALYAEGGKGFVNYKKALTKLQKKGDLDGKSYQEKVAMVQAAKTAQDTQEKIAKIKKKFGDGTKLSPSELALYKTLEPDVKGEIRILAQAKGIQKELEDELDAYNKAIAKKPLLVPAYNLDTPNKLINLAGNPQQKLTQIQVAKQKLKDALESEDAALKEIKPFINDSAFGGKAGSIKAVAVKKLMADWNQTPDFYNNVPGGTLKEKLAALNKAQDEAIADEVAKQKLAQQKLFKYENADKGSGLLAFKKVFNDLEKGGDLDGLGPVEMLAKVDEVANAAKAKADFDSIKSSVSGKLAKGQTLTPAKQKWYDNLDASDKETVDAIVAQKQAKAGLGPTIPKAPPATPDNQPTLVFSDFKQIGDQGGSNLGGEFINNRTGTRYYVKAPESEVAAKVEVLSSKLYQMAGVRVADIDLLPITGDIGGVSAVGRLGIASRMETVTDLDTGSMAKLAGAKDGFVADAWLANWDVIGNGSPKQLNLKKLKDGSAMRIDTGGTLFFRAQGGRKAFDANDVPELDSLRDRRLNANGADVFGDIKEDQIVAGVARIVAIADDDIRRIVRETMADDADDLAEILIGRKNFLAAKYEKQLAKLNKQVKPTTADTAQLARSEAKIIKNSKKTGYSINFDKDSIEDQSVHFWEYIKNGKSGFGVSFKVRGAISDKLTKEFDIADAASVKRQLPLDELDGQFSTTLRGIGALARDGKPLRDTDFERIRAARQFYDNAISNLEQGIKAKVHTAAQKRQFVKYYMPWLEDLESAVLGKGVGDSVTWTPHTTALFKSGMELVEVTKKAQAVKWKRTKIKWNSSDMSAQGISYDVGKISLRSVDALQYADELIEVNYFPKNIEFVALRDLVDIRVIGDGLDDLNRGLKRVEDLGFDLSRPTMLTQEELYLSRFVYMKAARNPSVMKILEKDFTDQSKRIEYLRKEASKLAGVDDITALPTYRPTGSWEKNGYGRHLQDRPDLYGKEWEQFKKDYVLVHDFTYMDSESKFVQKATNIYKGGGHMAPTVDKLRRGVPLDGASSEADLTSGGASYAFMRLRPARSANTWRGLVMKPNSIKRLDAITYGKDNFGRTLNSDGTNFVLENRYTKLEEFKKLANNNWGNETVFKNSISLIDEDVLYINCASQSETTELVANVTAALKNMGFSKWPDGRKITDVIRYVPGASN